MAGSAQQMANVNFSRYSSAVFLVAQKEVWRVFDWLHRHHYHGQPWAYVGERLLECEGVSRRRIGAMERIVLDRQDDPSVMDIPMLYLLLQHTCGLRPDGPDWTSPGEEGQQPSLEHRLYLIKQVRNKMSHCTDQYMHMSDQCLDSLLQELSEHLCHALRQAGQRSAQPAEEVEAAVASVRDRLAHIQASVPPSAILPQEFAMLAKRELQEQWKESGSRGQQLTPPLLRWALDAQEVALDQLLQGPRGEAEQPPKVLAVVGEAGIGKSSLCWQLAEAWLQDKAAAGAAEVVVMVECRQVFTRDLTRLLLDLLPQTCCRCQPEEVLGLLGALRVLWLVDGFEEASGDARDLLQRLVKWCSSSSGGHVVLVTCQPHYREELNVCLAPDATPCYTTHRGLTNQGFHSMLATLLQGGQEAAGEAMEGRAEAGEETGKEAEGEETGGGGGKAKQGQGERRNSEEVEALCKVFLKDVQELHPNLLWDLHNPLKLVLAVHLWEGGQLKEAAGAPLTRLYAAIQEVLVAKLVARVRAMSRLTEEEVRERVRLWVEELCKAALTMWGRRRFVALDKVAEQLLKQRAVHLMLPYTDCFSIFLVHRSAPGPRYSFLHHTQQSVLAAQHLHTLLLQNLTAQELRAHLLPGPPPLTTTTTTSASDTTTTNTATTTTTTTTTSTTNTAVTISTLPDAIAALSVTTAPLDHFLDILIVAAASLAAAGSLSEGRAKVLTELLEQCQNCPWLEVVRHTACCPTLAREVRPHLTEVWRVTDAYVQVCAVLADIQTPEVISIELHDNPDNLLHLMPLLHCLAKGCVRVELHNKYSLLAKDLPPSPCDRLLYPLCDPASLCSLIAFSGTLSSEGYRILRRQQHNLVVLVGGVLDHTALEELIQLTYHTESLQEVAIFLYNTFTVLPSKPVSPRVWTYLKLVCVEAKEAENAVILVRRINHTFRTIMLLEVAPSTVCRMVKAFRKERVRTLSLGKAVWIKVFDIWHFIRVGFFPLPLPTNMTLRDVYLAFKNPMNISMKIETHVVRGRRGTDMGMLDLKDDCGGVKPGGETRQ